MDDLSDEEINTDDDYYTFLNVSKNATTEEINSAYRNLSRIYHPDKHVNVDKKTEAEILFNRTKKAYEVLSDPHKRAIYDSLGNKGLEIEGWEIIHRVRTPAEIREEYEELARKREERKLQQSTNPRGTIMINVNATEIFNSYVDEYSEPGFPNIEVSKMSISQSIEAPINSKNTVVMQGSLASQNSVGSGGFMISGRRLINKGWLELDFGAGNGPVVGFKGSRNITNKIFTNGGASLNFQPNGILPGIFGTLAVQLDKYTVGYLTYNAGLQSSMSTVLERNTENYHWQMTVLVGIPHCFLFCSYTRKFIEHELKLRLAAKAGTFGYYAEYGAEKKISKYSTVVATVSVGVPSGVSLRLKLIRSTQTYIFPIHLSEEIVPAAIFYASVTPLLVWFIVKKTIIEPMNTEQKKRDIDKVKETNRVRLAEKKKEAEAAISLMSAMYDRICNDEKKKLGLIIIKAEYGVFEMENNSGPDWHNNNISGPKIIDVTIPLQCLVKDSKLILHEYNKCELPGFYDPCVGEKKQLKIDYIYKNVIYNIVIADNESLKIPNITSNTINSS